MPEQMCSIATGGALADALQPWHHTALTAYAGYNETQKYKKDLLSCFARVARGFQARSASLDPNGTRHEHEVLRRLVERLQAGGIRFGRFGLTFGTTPPNASQVDERDVATVAQLFLRVFSGPQMLSVSKAIWVLDRPWQRHSVEPGSRAQPAANCRHGHRLHASHQPLGATTASLLHQLQRHGFATVDSWAHHGINIDTLSRDLRRVPAGTTGAYAPRIAALEPLLHNGTSLQRALQAYLVGGSGSRSGGRGSSGGSSAGSSGLDVRYDGYFISNASAVWSEQTKANWPAGLWHQYTCRISNPRTRRALSLLGHSLATDCCADSSHILIT